jgi:hypothetical protein
LIAHDGTVLEALIAQLPAVEASVLSELPAIDASLLALKIAGLHPLDPLRTNVAALDPAVGARHAHRMSVAALCLDRAAAMTAVLGRKCLALHAGRGKAAAAVALGREATADVRRRMAATAADGAHLEAAVTAAATVAATVNRWGGRSTASAMAAATVAAAVYCGTLAASAVAAIAARLCARRHCNRHRGDASGKEEPGHKKSPSMWSNGPCARTFHRLPNQPAILTYWSEPWISLLFRYLDSVQ